MLVTFLQLSAEFGGTKFGPFKGVEIRLGSDPDLNDISLPEALGVASEHVKVLKQNETSYIIAPVDRTATIYIWRQGSAKPKQITTPMAVTVGDGFSLVTPEGPRFYITTEQLMKNRDKVGGSFAEKAAKRMPSSRGLLEEVKRRGFAKVFSTKLGNIAMYGYRFVISGQIFNPVYIVAGIMMFSGWFLASGATCAAFSQSKSKNTAAKKWRTCEDQKAGLKSGSGENRATVPILTRNILIDNEWKPTLNDDRELYKVFAFELGNSFGRAEQFRWAYQSEKSKTMVFRRHLNGLSEGLLDTLTYAAAQPSRTGAREWTVMENSDGNPVCGRGPLALTYRQAINLGLENVQLDALVSNSVAISQSVEEKRTKLLATAEFQSPLPALVGVTIADAGGATVQGGQECMHLEGEDDRDDLLAVARRLKTVVGSSARGVPSEGQPYWIAARLVKLGAMDFIHNYDDLKFSSTSKPPMQNLAAQDVLPKHREFAATYAAKVMANAVVTRCMAILDKDNINNEPEFMGTLPDLSQCAVIKAFVEYDRL